jgi:hypothetical protein
MLICETLPSMPDLELRRTEGDRRLYAPDGAGTLRLQGFFTSSAGAESDGESRRFARRGFWSRSVAATSG